MPRALKNNDYTASSIAIIIISALLMGVNGVIAFILLFIISEKQSGRDPINKHGLAKGKSRLGGVTIALSIIIGCCSHLFFQKEFGYQSLIMELTPIIFLSLLIGAIGLIEDFNQNLSSIKRLSLMLFMVSIGLYMMPELIPVNLPVFMLVDLNDSFMTVYLFTVLMICGFINAGNMADGANGLLATIFFGFFLVAYSLDNSIFNFSVIISLIAFIIFNVTTGKIFLGDFGAYTFSALVALKSLEFYANYDLSVFFLGSIVVYPCFEIIRSMIVRSLRKSSLMNPDHNHLHNLINTFIRSKGLSKHVSNSFTGLGLAITTISAPLTLYFTGFSIESEYWSVVFILQILFLLFTYIFFEKKFSADSNRCYN